MKVRVWREITACRHLSRSACQWLKIWRCDLFITRRYLTSVSIQSMELDPMTPWVATCTETGGLIRWQLNHLIHNSVVTKVCDLVSIMTPSCNNVLWLTWLAQFLFARVIRNITYRHEDIHYTLKIKKMIKQSLYFLKYMQVDCIQ